jgi:Na+-driven multidrug efflux pump
MFLGENNFMTNDDETNAPSLESQSLTDILNRLKPLIQEQSAIVLPSIASTGLLYACNFYITVLIGREGNDYVAAASYINRFKALFLISPNYFFWGMQSCLPKALKAQEENQADAPPDLIVITAVFYTIPMSLLSMILLSQVGNILHVIGEDPDHIALVEDYYNMFIWAVPAYVGLQIILQLLPTSNRSNNLMLLALLRFTLDVGFSSFFFFELEAGFSSWAMANIIQTWGSFLICLAVLFSSLGKSLREDIGFKNTSEYFNLSSFSFCKQFMYLGAPIAFQTCFAVLSGVLLTLFAGKLPENDLVAFNITSVISYWSIVLLEPFATGANVVVNKGKSPRDIHTITSIAALLFILPLTFMMLFEHHQLTELFIGDDSEPEIFEITAQLMPIYSVFTLAYALKTAATGIFRGKKDTVTPFHTEMLGAFLISVAGGAIFTFSKDKSIVGIGASEVLGTLISMFLLTVRLRNTYLDKKLFNIGVGRIQGCLWTQKDAALREPLNQSSNDDLRASNNILLNDALSGSDNSLTTNKI